MRKAVLLLVFLALLPACRRIERNGSPDPQRPSHEVIQGIEIDRDIVYRSVDGVELALDAYRPVAAAGPLPALILIHGGGWATGTKDESTSGAVRLAKAGFAVFVMDYRLAPPGGRWTAPAQIEDPRAAVEWVRESGARYGADEERIGAMGSSAGGNLALLLGTTGTPGGSRVDAVASFSGPTDLTDDDAPFFARQQEILENYLGCPLGSCPELAREVSPLEHASRGDAPTFLANSTSEMVPVDQARRFGEALQRSGVDVELVEVPGARHGVAIARQLAPQAVAFLLGHLE